jgi:hypothetical protein
MCLVHRLADGRWLIDDGPVSDDPLVDVGPGCSGNTATAVDREGGPGLSRQQLLGCGAAATAGATLAGTWVCPAPATAQQPAACVPVSGDRIVMLGLNGGPVLSKLRIVAPSELDQIVLRSEGEA